MTDFYPKKLKLKIVFLGNISVGKTSLLNRIAHNKFQPNSSASIAEQIKLMKFKREGIKMTLELWDTAGQEKFKCVAPSFFRDVKVAILCYSLNDPKSLESMDEWLDILRQFNSPLPKCYLVGCKRDLEENDPDIIQQVAKKTNLTHFKTSAKTGQGIQELLELILKEEVQRASLQQLMQLEDSQSTPHHHHISLKIPRPRRRPKSLCMDGAGACFSWSDD